MGKKSHKCVGNFITDAMVILPIYFGKFTIYGNISMEIGIMGKFPWIYGTTP
jgi:hypothetical protein